MEERPRCDGPRAHAAGPGQHHHDHHHHHTDGGGLEQRPAGRLQGHDHVYVNEAAQLLRFLQRQSIQTSNLISCAGMLGALVPCCLDLSLAHQFGECLCLPLLPGSTFAMRVGIRERYKIRVSGGAKGAHWEGRPGAAGSHGSVPAGQRV